MCQSLLKQQHNSKEKKTMSDIRIQRMAQVLVQYSSGSQEG